MTGDDPDPLFTEPYVDCDEWRAQPVRHRYVHGGFAGTETRFSLYFPPEALYRDRYFTVVEGGQAGHEDRAAALTHHHLPSIAWAATAGGYLVESNGGHIVTTALSYTHGSQDVSVTAYRATAAATRYARQYATRVYGRTPRHGYVLGASGGGRALLALENTSGVWDGAVQFVNAAGHGPSLPELVTYTVHVLGDDLARVAAATGPGGSGDPFAGLSVRQRQALATLYRSGFQRGGEFQLLDPGPEFAVMRILSGLAATHHPRYFHDFWTERGYAGADGELDADIVDETVTVDRVTTLADLTGAQRRQLAGLQLRLDAVGRSHASTVPIGFAVPAAPPRALGADLIVLTGPAAGRRLGCIGRIEEILVADFANGDDLSGLAAGTTIRIDNRRFLAYCFMHRHQVDPDGPGASQFCAAGQPVYRQEPQNLQDTLVGVRMQARFDGKVVYVGSLNDSMSNPLGWPVTYASRVRSRLGEAATSRLRVWLNENATHIQGSERPSSGPPAPATRLVDWIGCAEQAVDDLVAWVEDDQPPPPDTRFTCSAGQLELPRGAAGRGGLQPVVSATADGGVTARVAAGTPVLLAADTEVPPGAGRIVAIEWDFDGTGTWPYREATIDGTSPAASAAVRHTYTVPGTYYPAVRVTAHRRGDMTARYGLTCNLARLRVDVS